MLRIANNYLVLRCVHLFRLDLGNPGVKISLLCVICQIMIIQNTDKLCYLPVNKPYCCRVKRKSKRIAKLRRVGTNCKI